MEEFQLVFFRQEWRDVNWLEASVVLVRVSLDLLRQSWWLLLLRFPRFHFPLLPHGVWGQDETILAVI